MPANNKWQAILVEDDLELQPLIIHHLQARHCTVKTFITGRVVIDYLRRRPVVDLAICDLILPGYIDGTKCIREIHSAAPAAPIIAITQADPDLCLIAKVSGASAIIRKPFTSAIIEEAIDRALWKCKMLKESKVAPPPGGASSRVP